MSVKEPIKTKVNTTYSAGAHEGLNKQASATLNKTVSNAESSAEKAYNTAVSNNNKAAAQNTATNSTLTRQIGNSMRKKNYSLTNRNVASAAAARNASTATTALTAANTNAAGTRAKTVSAAKVSAYKTHAQNVASNTNKDIQRSTSQAIAKAGREAQAAEAEAGRALKKANLDRNDKLQAKKEKYDKKQNRLSVYASTIENRYSSVKAVDKAIKKMKKSNTESKSQKLAYLRALRAKLQDAKKAASSGGGGGGRRGYGRRGYGGRGYGRRYGSYGSDVDATQMTLGDKGGSSKKKDGDDLSLITAYRNFKENFGKKKPTKLKGSYSTKVYSLANINRGLPKNARKSAAAKAKVVKRGIKHSKGKGSVSAIMKHLG